MNRRLRLMVLGLVAVFIALACWWVVWFPYNPQRVREAIPAQAVLVSEHHHLAADALSLLHNPAMRESFEVLGGDPAGIDDFMSSRLGRWLTRCLGGRYALVGYLPHSRHGGPPAWVAASWGGARAQVVRWLVEGGLISGWTRLPGRSPVPCYSLDGAGQGPTLSAAIYEGIVLLCYSPDPAGVRDLTYQLAFGGEASDLPTGDILPADRVRVHWPTPPEAKHRSHGELAWDVSSTNRIGVQGPWPVGLPLPAVRSWAHRSGFTGLVPGVRLPALAMMPPRAPSPGDWQRLQAGLGPVAGGLVVAPAAALETVLGAMADSKLARLYRETLAPWVSEGGMMVVGLLREEHSGRLLRIKTPSLVVALSVEPDLDLDALFPPVLDRWNAAFGLALLARRRDDGASTFLIIDDARRGIYSSMKAEEKPTVWRTGGWLFVASNLRAANAVRSRLNGPATNLPQGDWWQMAQAQPADIHAWVDFAAAGTAVRKLTALHAIVQMARGQRSGHAVAVMENTGRVVSALTPFGDGVARAALTPDYWTLDAWVGR